MKTKKKNLVKHILINLKTKKKKNLVKHQLLTFLPLQIGRETEMIILFTLLGMESDGRQPLIYMLERKTKEKDHAISSIKLIYIVGQSC